MSMYAEYLKEKTDDHITETTQGFVVYRYMGDVSVYIVDIYILPDFRHTHVASTMADTIVEEARRKGCIKLIGSVVPSNKNSTASLKVLLSYGMTLKSSTNDFLVFEKDI
jgi:ribosomal protein S18 acetylase RimI-like enzyme